MKYVLHKMTGHDILLHLVSHYRPWLTQYESKNLSERCQYLSIRSSKTCANHLIQSQEDFLLHLSLIVVAGINLVFPKHAAMQGLLGFDCSSRILEGNKHKPNSGCHLH